MELEYDPLACFGRHLAATRREAGVSQEALAYEIGMSRSYLSEVERGLRNIALRNICILAKALSVPPGKLFEFEQVPAVAEGRKQAGIARGRKGRI